MRTHTTLRLVSIPLAALAAFGLAACGDDETPPAAVDSTAPTSSVPGDTTPDTTVSGTSPDSIPGTTVAGSTIEHPTGADDVVLRIAYEGGFVPPDYAFRNLPTLLVTGDGRAIVQGPVIEIYPGPLLPNLQVRTVTEQGIQDLLSLAADHGLLAEREYTAPTNIADASDTVVEIAANGETYRHQAYALGMSGGETESDAARQDLLDFVTTATNEWFYGDNPELGPEQAYASDSFLIRATEVGVATDATTVSEIPPTVVDWPADASVRLADAGECAEVPASEVGQLFAEANQLTYFADGGVTYQLAVKPLIPGDSC